MLIKQAVTESRPMQHKGDISMNTKSVSLASAPIGFADDAAAMRSSVVTRTLTFISSLDRVGMGMLRLGLVVVLLWIGGLKFASYEADSIVPLVANSPVTSFLYHYPAPEYRHYMNKEGDLKPANKQWHQTNGTYPVSYGLGIIIVSLGISSPFTRFGRSSRRLEAFC